MRPILLSITTAVLLAIVGPASADPGKDGRGKGRGGPPPSAARDDKDLKESYKKLDEQRREARERYEDQIRANDRRARQAEREPHGNLLAQVYRGDYEGYRHSGYRGYTPTVPYPNITPQPGGYGGDPAQQTYPNGNGPVPGLGLVDQILGSIGASPGYGQGQGGYGGYPPPGPVPYRGYAPSPPGGYDGPPDSRVNPYLTGQYYPNSPGVGPGYPPPDGSTGPPPLLAAPYPGVDYLPPTNADVPQAPPGPPTGGQITALADRLVRQADAFLQAFLPKVGVVPESQAFLANGTALRDAATRFREVAFSGAPPAALAIEFRNVEIRWRQLEARMARVSKGRIGPNIATALQMGGTIEQIRRLMP